MLLTAGYSSTMIILIQTRSHVTIIALKKTEIDANALYSAEDIR
jgi:hypothetical protein